MPKILNHALTVVLVFAQISFVLIYFDFLLPVFRIYEAFKGTVVTDILNNDQFLAIAGHYHVSQAEIAKFPVYPFTALQSIGIILAIISILYWLKALIKLITNLKRQQYFTSENVHLIWLIIISQIYSIAADPFLAGADQLVRTHLGRVDIGIGATDWSDIFEDTVTLVIISVIYILFKIAEQMKQENDLTV
ncbi:DUF2975 domain-containing protein [Lentilactobacillus raoultii]|uniref:DUF2975 domain-containing protein n=1 Tax=Lentilactobacillus raoultii TaxID=1987503 RepID=A0ABW3PHQ0_9LACO|nr:DUF2975 domain-containing protein [Lentilactobacillus raoultii]